MLPNCLLMATVFNILQQFLTLIYISESLIKPRYVKIYGFMLKLTINNQKDKQTPLARSLTLYYL